jgi:hypothetical protein
MSAQVDLARGRTCTDDEGEADIDIVGSVSAYMLAKLARRERRS